MLGCLKYAHQRDWWKVYLKYFVDVWSAKALGMGLWHWTFGSPGEELRLFGILRWRRKVSWVGLHYKFLDEKTIGKLAGIERRCGLWKQQIANSWPSIEFSVGINDNIMTNLNDELWWDSFYFPFLITKPQSHHDSHWILKCCETYSSFFSSNLSLAVLP